MSGIAAIFYTSGAQAKADTLAAMLAALPCRTPDETHSWAEGPVALGHATRHSTAEGRQSHQPLASADGRLRLVFDGYLANIDELRRTLHERGARLRDNSDAELVLHAYEAWGEGAAKQLEGEFAFILWDGRRNELFCARDHQGLRPLYYHWDGQRLLLASDVAAILAALPHRPALNMGYLAELLRFSFYTTDETVWSGIMRLPPAHGLCARTNGIDRTRYWALDCTRRLHYPCAEDYAEQYRALLFESVRRSARTDAPLAVEVSGGLDSTALFCVAHQLQQQDRLPAPELRGYTMAGPAGTPADEIEYVHAVTRQLGVTITETPYFLPELAWFTADANAHLDVPLLPNGAISLTEERTYAADGCRACINGVGGDQWLDGSMFYYRELSQAGDWREFARSAKADIAGIGLRSTARQILFKAIGPAAPAPIRAMARTMRKRVSGLTAASDIIALSPQAEEELQARRDRYLATLPADPHERLKWGKVEDPMWPFLYDLNARQAAMNGISQRHPMLARRYIEFMAAVPEHRLQRGGVKKLLHREALNGILPDQVRLRTSEGATDQVFTRHESALIETLRVDWPRTAETLVNRDEIKRCIATYCAAAIDSKPMLNLWMPYVIATVCGSLDRSTPEQ